MTINPQLPSWAKLLFGDFEDAVVYGGRGGGKSTTIALVLVLLAIQKKLRIVTIRQFQNSIKESNYHLFIWCINKLGLNSHFKFTNTEIISRNGSFFFFHGLERSLQSTRSWQDIDIAWVEEAQFVSEEAMRVLRPAIRKKGAKMIFSFNPEEPTDAVYKMFIPKPINGVVLIKVNYYDNPWFPKRLDRERILCKEITPWDYAHIWLGEIDSGRQARKVLPYKMIQDCIEAYNKLKTNGNVMPSGRLFSGYDVADTGGDFNAQTIQKSGVVLYAKRWQERLLWNSSKRVNKECNKNNIFKLFFDGGGIGAGTRSDLKRMKDRKYIIKPILFGSKPDGGDRAFFSGIINKDMFANKSAQMAWTIKMRSLLSNLYVNGHDIKKEKMLLFPPHIAKDPEFISQLSQPEWRELPTGKVIIDKQPDDKPSPDYYDSLILSFANDSKNGLRFPTELTEYSNELEAARE